MSLLARRPFHPCFVAVMAFPWFIYGQHWFALPIFVKELNPVDRAALFGRIMSMNAVIVVIFTVPIVRLTRKIRPITNVSIHSVLYAFGSGMLNLIGQYLHGSQVFILCPVVPEQHGH